MVKVPNPKSGIDNREFLISHGVEGGNSIPAFYTM